MSRELGDFQTPPELVRDVLACCMRERDGAPWTRALEPTCGKGGFVAGLLAVDPQPREIVGLEVQPDYVAAASALERNGRTTVTIRQANIFDVHFADLRWTHAGPLLVVGNPPWVTNAELGAIGSRNLPRKSNLKRASGLDAMTGSSNFDISEFIWLKLLTELAAERPTIALLCKTSVARNVLHHAAAERLPIGRGSIRRIDAPQWFGAAVDACLFTLTVRPGAEASYELPVFASLTARTHETTMAVRDGRVIADVDAYRQAAFADGVSPVTWRQGIKHDAAAVMELAGGTPASLTNRQGQPVQVESAFVHPLLKSTDLHRGSAATRWMIVPQQSIGDDTRLLERSAPQLWGYLTAHRTVFESRRSSIYRGQPPFAIFGVGAYTFAPYKVAVSGLHDSARFRVVGPTAGRTVVFDDTCYFAPCRSAVEAALLAAVMNGAGAQALIRALRLSGAKRPITKSLLQRVDVAALVRHAEREPLIAAAERYLHALGVASPAWPDDLALVLTIQSPRSP